MKRIIAVFAILCLLMPASYAESILPELKMTDQILYAPALRGVSELETPTPSSGSNSTKDYAYRNVSLDTYDAFSLALARAGYLLDATETDEESGNVTTDVSYSEIKLKIVYNPDNETMKITYPKGVLPSPDSATDQTIVQDASAAEGILPVIGVRYAPSISQVSFLTDSDPDALASGAQQYNYSPFQPVIYERFGAKLGEEGYSLVSAEEDETKGEQIIVVAKDNIELTLHYDSESARMKVDYPQRVKPAESDLTEYTRPIAIDEVFEVTQSGVVASVTNVTTVAQYTEDWRSVTPWFTRTDSSTYYAETDNEVFLWMSFLLNNQSADFSSRTPWGSISVRMITGETEKTYAKTYSGASSRVGYVNTRSGANEPIAPQTSASYQCVFEIPRAEFDAAEEIYAEIVSRDYAYKYVMCIRGENGQLKQE